MVILCPAGPSGERARGRGQRDERDRMEAEPLQRVLPVHSLSGVLEAGRHAVDGELDEVQYPAALRIVRREASQASE